MPTMFSRIAGYSRALKSKAEDMDDYELKTLFESVAKAKNNNAFWALAEVMEERDLVYKDENGKIHKNY